MPKSKVSGILVQASQALSRVPEKTYNLPDKKSYVLEARNTTPPEIPTALPFMAQQNAQINTIIGTKGTEPVYYSGKPRDGLSGTWDAVIGDKFKEWSRRTFANVFDPKLYLSAPTDIEKEMIKKRAEQYENLYSGKDGGIFAPFFKFTTDITGIKPEEFAIAGATIDVAAADPQRAGISVYSTAVTKAGGQAAWSALNIFQAFETRHGSAILLTADDLADSVAGKDDDRGLLQRGPLSGADKFNQAMEEKEFFLANSIPMWQIIKTLTDPDVAKFSAVLKQNWFGEGLHDVGRLVLNLDKLKPGQAVDTLNMNLRASQMVYSLFWEEARNADFIRRYEAGESPQKLYDELNVPGVELAGGILYDLTTYMGNIPFTKIKMLPELGEVLGLGLKSNVASEVAKGLEQVRVTPAIKQALTGIADFAEGAVPSTRQAALDVVKEAFIKTREEFLKYTKTSGFAVLVSTDKEKLAIREGGDVIRKMTSVAKDRPQGANELLGTIDAMRRMVLGGNEQEMAEAFTTLTKSPFGELPLSPAGMRLAAIMAEVTKDSEKVAKYVEDGDIVKLSQLYSATLEKTVGELIPSVDDMWNAASKARKGVEELTPQEVKLVEAYKTLKPATKALNVVNFIGQKSWMKGMGFFSTLYFDYNRFAYPIRNVISTIPAMAYEGLDALSDSAKAIVGSQIEPIGVNALRKMSAEVENLLGYVPEGFSRGGTAAGDFANADRKIFFGLFRGGGQVAELSEQLMSAQVMLKTIKREMNNVIKNGGLPEVDKLIKAGLGDTDAKRLLEIAMENTGSVSKTVQEFRKYIGDGVYEIYRNIKPPPKLQGFLDELGNGEGSLWKELDEARKTTSSTSEFKAASEAIWKKIETIAKLAETEPARMSDDVGETAQRLSNDASDLIRKKTLSPEAVDNFQRVVQGFRNARREMRAVFNTIYEDLGRKTAGIYSKELNTFDEAAETYERVDAVRNTVRDLYYGKKTANVQEAWKVLNEKFEDFKISDWTSAAPEKLNSKQLDRLMWEAFYGWANQHYMEKSALYNKQLIGILEKMAQEAGTNVDETAKILGVKYQDALGTFDDAVKQANRANIDVLSFTRDPKLAGMSLVDMLPNDLEKVGYKNKTHLFNAINQYRTEQGQKAWDTFEQVDAWEVMDTLQREKKQVAGVLPKKAERISLVPPLVDDKAPTLARNVYESMQGLKKDFDTFVEGTSARWGESRPVDSKFTDTVEEEFSKWATEFGSRMATARTEVGTIATSTRDAMLYPYLKTGGNVAGQYIMPFHYFHQKTVQAWLKNVTYDPKWAAVYIDYKEQRTQQAAGLPDWWKQNIAISGLPGMDKDNPLFFNIEATVNPLYSFMKEDYDDPARRQDWLSSLVDDVGKLGPALYQPLQWVAAANLYAHGKQEAFARNMGRLIPQTRLIKSVTNALGINIPLTKYNELDPFVNIFNDGLDPTEEKSALRYLAEMDKMGYSQEQIIDAANTRSGEVWDIAVNESLAARAPAEMASYFVGIGFKPRTQNDILTDQFYDDYRKLVGARDMMASDDYTQAWNAMRIKYPFMDAILIGRKQGEDKDTAYSYNVLSRIPPAEMDDIAAFVGIKSYMLQEFYDNKGDLTKFTPADRLHFMGGIIDIAGMLKLPSGATREEWTLAKTTYQDMNVKLKSTFGDDIVDKMNMVYKLPEHELDQFFKDYPEVQQAFNVKNQYIMNTPILSEYYASLNTVDKYYSNQMYEQLQDEFGVETTKAVDVYYMLKDNLRTDEANAVYKDFGLKRYFERKSQLEDKVNSSVINSLDNIPEGTRYQIRDDFLPKSETQQEAVDFTQAGKYDQQTAGLIWNDMTPALQALVADYYAGQDLTYEADKQLDYIGRKYGMDADTILQVLGNAGLAQ